MSKLTVNQKIEQIVFNYNSTGNFKLTLEFITERYNDTLRKYGESKALEILNHQWKDSKVKYKEAERKLLNKIKWDIIEKVGCVPSALRDIKHMIAAGNTYNLESVEEYYKRFTHMQWQEVSQ